MTHSTRQAARSAGQRFYFPGKPCVNGHTSARYVSTGNCAECQRERRTAEQVAARTAAEATGQGSRLFSYKLHPHDHAAALAFCQALDLQRGRVPAASALDFTPPKAAAFATGAPLVLPPAQAQLRAILDAVPDLAANHDAHRDRL